MLYAGALLCSATLLGCANLTAPTQDATCPNMRIVQSDTVRFLDGQIAYVVQIRLCNGTTIETP